MKIRITQKYTIHITEVHEVEVEDQEEINFLHEEQDNATEFTHEDTLIEKIEGDCVSGSWEVTWEEINALDQIVEAINAEEAIAPDTDKT